MARRYMFNKGFNAGPLSVFALAFFLLIMAGGASAFTLKTINLLPSGPTHRVPHLKEAESAPAKGFNLFKGKFLVAAGNMRDPRFAKSVVLLTYYGASGASGIIINHPSEVKLSDVMPDVGGGGGAVKVYFGGPVEIGRMMLLVRAADAPEESVRVFADVYVSTSVALLERLLKDKDAPKTFRVYAGYAGWVSGQLEREVMKGVWQIVDGEAEAVFAKEPLSLWPGLIR